jgi:gliding motility-associated-like protein
LITGADNCEFIGTAELLSPAPFSIDSEVINTCFADSTGSISVEVSGGTGNLDFNWSGPNGFTSNTSDIAELLPGDYELIYSDQNSCTDTATFEIIENPEIQLSADTTSILCFGDSTGQIDLSRSGGTPPYSYAWNGPNGFTSSLEDIDNLIAGTYQVEVSDSVGCSITENYEIVEPDSIEVTQDVVSAGCSPDSPGEIALFVEGGTDPYGVSWTGPDGFTSTEFTISDLAPGSYVYSVFDDNSCSVVDSIEIDSVAPLQIDLVKFDISCNGATDGSVMLNVSGGSSPYTFNWSGPDGFQSEESEITQLSAGEYTLVVSDASGCNETITTEIIAPEPLVITTGEVMDATCQTLADGTITTSISGGTEPYDISWSGPDGFTADSTFIDQILPGQYIISATDSNNCSSTDTVTVDFVLEITASAGSDLNICANELPLEITGEGLNASNFLWLNLDGDTLSTDTTLEINNTTGNYEFILLAGNGFCSISDTVEVEVLETPEANAGPDLEVFAEAPFTLGGSPTSPTGVDYSWTPNPTGSLDTTLANPSGFLVETTQFTVEVTDQNGCVGTDTVLVEVLPEVQVTSGFTPNNDGINDTWIIDNMELFPNNVVNIFNRWGEAVYQANGYNSGNAWDGTYEGEPLPVGTYYYTIELNDEKFPEPLTGPITINR